MLGGTSKPNVAVPELERTKPSDCAKAVAHIARSIDLVGRRLVSYRGPVATVRLMSLANHDVTSKFEDWPQCMIDANHHTGELTYILPDGKPLQARGEFNGQND